VANILKAEFVTVYEYSAEDAYNFYLSQLRITIERAFGILEFIDLEC
jgi:hypothetical protein